MTDLSGRILSSLSDFDIPDDIHETSDAISSFAFIVNDLNVERTMDSMIMAVVKAVHDSCPNVTFRYDAIRSLKIKVESYFLQYEDMMKNEQRDPLESFTVDVLPIVSDVVTGHFSDIVSKPCMSISEK